MCSTRTAASRSAATCRWSTRTRAREEEASWDHYHQAGDLDHHGRVDVMSDMSRYDGERLHSAHRQPRALYQFEARRNPRGLGRLPAKFRKVMPVEYRRALQEMKAPTESRSARGGRRVMLAVRHGRACPGPSRLGHHSQCPPKRDARPSGISRPSSTGYGRA